MLPNPCLVITRSSCSRERQAADVGPEDGVVRLKGLGGQLARVAGKAGVVDGDIQLPEGLDCAVDQGLDVAGDADIRPEVLGLRPQRPQLGRERLAVLVAPPGDDDSRPRAGEGSGRRPPEPAKLR